MRDHGLCGHGRDIAARIGQKRGEVVGAVTLQRVLKVEQSCAGGTGAIGQPEQVFGVEVAQDHHIGIGGMGGERGLHRIPAVRLRLWFGYVGGLCDIVVEGHVPSSAASFAGVALSSTGGA